MDYVLPLCVGFSWYLFLVRMLESLAGCRVMFLFGVFCKIGALNHLAKNSGKKYSRKCPKGLHIFSRVLNFPSKKLLVCY